MAAVDTNTVHVKLPQGLGVQPAADAMSRFGEVSHVEVVDASNLTLLVVFFDVRAAAAAQKALGETCCKAGQQTGSRTVHLPANVQIGVESIRGISSAKPDPDEESCLILEFFDTRDAGACAWKVAQAARKEQAQVLADQEESRFGALMTALATPAPGLLPPGLEPPPGLCLPNRQPRSEQKEQISGDAKVPEPPSEAPPAPAVVNTLPMNEVEVLIKNLPESLCSDAALGAMFEQAEVERYVTRYQVRLLSNVGEARVTFKSRRAGKNCVKHFNGRVWDAAGSPVEAEMLTPAAEKLETREKSQKAKSRSRAEARQAKGRGSRAESQLQMNKAQFDDVMANFFSSPAGRKLLFAESEEAARGAGINWDDFDDWSD